MRKSDANFERFRARWFVAAVAYALAAVPSALVMSQAGGAGGGAEKVPPQPTTEPATTADPGAEVGADDPDEAEADLVLKDGRQVSGAILARTPDHIILRINGIATPFPAEDIVSTDEKAPVSQRYREMRAAIDDSDIEQRIRLVEWLRGRRKYTLALNEVTGVLAREADNPEALRLQNWLNEQLKLRRAAQAKASGKGKADGAKEVPFLLLNAAEINLMRVYEVELGDPPRMFVEPEGIKKLIETYAGSPLIPATNAGREGLYRKRPAQILELMFKLQARELYGMVQIQEDPASIKQFRERVHGTWLMNACATSQCHGGEEAGRFWLAAKRPNTDPNTDPTVYTNLLILDRFRVAAGRGAAGGAAKPDERGGEKPDGKLDGKADGRPGVGIPLIDYDDPAKSPLLQMGLPRTRSLYPHPEVGGRLGLRGFSPVFQTMDDRRFEDAVEWIRGMYRPRPQYPIEYTPPSSKLVETEDGGKKGPVEPAKER